jgi:hypothetical protein
VALGFIRPVRRAALSAGAWSAWLGSAGETCPLSGSETAGPCEDRSARRKATSFGGICALGTLAEGFQPTRLETRTKESNMYASRWVENP